MAEVKVVLSGFVVHGYLGVLTRVVKMLALVLSVASGLGIGSEGPYVHIATCVGNIACRFFTKYNRNDGKRRGVLSAAAASDNTLRQPKGFRCTTVQKTGLCVILKTEGWRLTLLAKISVFIHNFSHRRSSSLSLSALAQTLP